MRRARLSEGLGAGAIVLVALVGMAGCGSSSSSSNSTSQPSSGASAKPAATPTTLALSIAEAGKTGKYTAPASVKGGLVTVQLTNNGKMPHGGQLIRILGKHTVIQALMALGGSGNGKKTPPWLRAEGGAGSALPGATAKTTGNLPPGNYVVVDLVAANAGPGGGPPAFVPLSVTPGQTGPLPSTPTTVTAAAPSKDHYKWNVAGPLKAGANDVTFVSKGRDALHFLGAFRITGNPSTARIAKDLASNGPPPKYVDQSSQVVTGALDGGKSLTTQLTLSQPGTYVLFCPLTDRNGGKPHFAEGMLTKVAVK